MSWPFWITTCAIMIPGILWASWIDYKERRVPNWLNAVIGLIGLGMQAWFFGWEGMGQGLLGCLVGFVALILPWMMHGMGAGDVKLMMAIGVWLGPWWTFISFCVGVIVGGIIAVVMILSTGRLWSAYANMTTIMNKMSDRSKVFTEYGSAKSFATEGGSQLLPYGVPLTIGTLMVFFGPAFSGILV